MPAHVLNLSTRLDLLSQLRERRLETDQRLAVALERLPPYSEVPDHYLFLELLRLNSVMTKYLDAERFAQVAAELESDTPVRRTAATPSHHLAWLLEHAMKHRREEALGSLDVIRALACSKRGVRHRPSTLNVLALMFGGSVDTAVVDIPGISRLFDRVEGENRSVDDFSFIVTAEQDRLVVRIATVLGDYVESSGGVLVPHRAMLTHFCDRFGGFLSEEIDELETLINSPALREQALQRFFETHPHFFRRWDHQEVYPQLYLHRTDGGGLVPDFILTDRELQRAMIVDLKLPSAGVVRRQRNRDRFASAVMEARAQLRRYRDWFRIPSNRDALRRHVKMSIFEPQLAVVIGRSADFEDEIERQQLRADDPDIDVVTYDDIVAFARRRRLFLDRTGVHPGLSA